MRRTLDFLAIMMFLSLATSGLVSPAHAQGTPEAQAQEENGIRLSLIDRGQIVYGTLSVSSIKVETEFGSLEIPIKQIRSFTPGLESHPQEQEKINRLIQELGGNEPEVRDNAQRQLLNYGPGIRPILQKFVEDDDSERRTRIAAMLDELDSFSDDDFGMMDEDRVDLIPLDSIETELFTVVGRIEPKSFQVTTNFGKLDISLADIRQAQRHVGGVEEIRKSFDVTGMHMADTSWKNSGVRVNRGDEVTLTADGQIIMSPWGNNSTSTPDGSPNYQWYKGNEIPGGALVYRIGDSGEVQKGGSKKSFVADRSGELQFGVGIPSQFANQGYSFPGQYNVKLRVKTAK